MAREDWWVDTDEQHQWLLDFFGIDTRAPEYAPGAGIAAAILVSNQATATDSPVAAGAAPTPSPAASPPGQTAAPNDPTAATNAPAAPPASQPPPAAAPPSGWVYHQSTGELTLDGAHVATGHSGDGQGRNNPSMQSTPFVGPTPQGSYAMGQQFSSPNTGPGAIRLTPLPGTNTYGRTDLEVHGGSRTDPAHDSTGCIILPPNVRSRMAGQTLTVVP